MMRTFWFAAAFVVFAERRTLARWWSAWYEEWRECADILDRVEAEAKAHGLL